MRSALASVEAFRPQPTYELLADHRPSSEFVRHFKETIPLQTTAMDEVATILGGADHLEEALLNLKNRAKPAFIGVATTALVETRGEDFVGELAQIKARRAAEHLLAQGVVSNRRVFENGRVSGGLPFSRGRSITCCRTRSTVG